jgi:hypothetical protein
LLPVGRDPWRAVVAGQGITAENVVRGLLPHHDRGRVGVAVGDLREDRRIGQPQAIHPDHPRLWVHHGAGIVRAPHPAGAAGVIGAFGMFPDRVVERRVVGCVDARQDLVARETCHRRLGHDLPRQADGAAEIDPVLRWLM